MATKNRPLELKVVGEDEVPEYDLGLKEGEKIPENELRKIARTSAYLQQKDETEISLNPEYTQEEAESGLRSAGILPEYVAKARELNEKISEKKLEIEVEEYIEGREGKKTTTARIMYEGGKNILKETYEIGKGCYRLSKLSFLSAHAFPTAFKRYDSEEGAVMGILSGLTFDFIVYGGYLNLDPNPKYLLIPLATNVASGIYEWYRHSKKKAEKLNSGGK